MPTVHVIEGRDMYKKKRVAAYARVSTQKENQEDSFETQCAYYETLIESTPNWIFTKVYADHGFSGVSAEKRPGFMEMIQDARWREFDILLVRSISRFARNVKEAQLYCRELKVLGIEVRFERERISSTDSSAEMAFHLLACCAQEESRSISERTKWSIHTLQEQGILHIGNRALGYEEVDGVLTPTDEAWAVQEMFEQYANGVSIAEIADTLYNRGFRRKKTQKPMSRSSIAYMLHNPIYVGDRYLQKQAPKHYMTHKPDPWQAYDSYYIKNAHTGIISRGLWERVQMKRVRDKKRLRAGIRPRRDSHFLYGKLFCGECGAPMKRRGLPHKGDKVMVWNCENRCRHGGHTETDVIREVCVQLGVEENELTGRLDAIERITVHENRIDVVFAAV